MSPKIKLNSEVIKNFCEKNRIKKLSLFGSVIRDDFRPDSDVDMLVEFEPNCPVGFIRMAGIENELSDLVGRKVDLRTPAELSRYFRQEVLNDALIQYAQK